MASTIKYHTEFAIAIFNKISPIINQTTARVCESNCDF